MKKKQEIHIWEITNEFIILNIWITEYQIIELLLLLYFTECIKGLTQASDRGLATFNLPGSSQESAYLCHAQHLKYYL